LPQTVEYFLLFSGWLTKTPSPTEHLSPALAAFDWSGHVRTPALIDMCRYQVRGLMRTKRADTQDGSIPFTFVSRFLFPVKVAPMSDHDLPSTEVATW
jgi:hypothetical protein